MADLEGLSVPQSRSSPGSLDPVSAECKVGPARGSVWTPVRFLCSGMEEEFLVGPELTLPGPSVFGPTAPTPFPSSSSLCTLAPGAGGRGGGWSFTFFRSSLSCRKQHQMTRAGCTAPLPEALGGWAWEFPGRRARRGREGGQG